ncbi:MAG: hypothetical protein H7174_06320 [Flavobacterium sp.]|nr:hypothetical protein [Flavobacterium sp.]
MIGNLPTYISLIFGLATIATLLLFYWAVKKSSNELTSKKANIILFSLTIWLIIQSILTLGNIYSSDTTSIPPKIILLGIFPTILIIIFLFATRKGRQFIDSLPLINLIYINIVRIPIEFVLLWLFINKAVPQLMTFEGRNFDIIAGITAPFIAYYCMTNGKLSRKIILVWNFVCLALLINIIVIALLSAPSPLQKFAFDQPNIAILNFPFSWLPTFIVPIILFGHLTSIRHLIKSPQHG